MKALVSLIAISILLNSKEVICQGINQYNSSGQKTGVWISEPDSLRVLLKDYLSDKPNHYKVLNVNNNFYNLQPIDTSEGSIYAAGFEPFLMAAYNSKLTFHREYKNDTLHGAFKILLFDTLVVVEGSYSNGFLNGSYYKYRYFRNEMENRESIRFSTTLYLSKINGYLIHYLGEKNQKYITTIRFYENGIQQGIEKHLFSNGNIHAIYHFKNGSLYDGWYGTYTPLGYQMRKIKNNKLVKYKQYDEEGNLYRYMNRKKESMEISTLRRLFDCKCFFRMRKPYLHPQKGIIW